MTEHESAALYRGHTVRDGGTAGHGLLHCLVLLAVLAKHGGCLVDSPSLQAHRWLQVSHPSDLQCSSAIQAPAQLSGGRAETGLVKGTRWSTVMFCSSLSLSLFSLHLRMRCRSMRSAPCPATCNGSSRGSAAAQRAASHRREHAGHLVILHGLRGSAGHGQNRKLVDLLVREFPSKQPALRFALCKVSVLLACSSCA